VRPTDVIPNRAEYAAKRPSIRQGARMAGEAVMPETRYARLGPDRLAYQIVAQGVA
jgi:hypothetical protein